MHHDCTLELSNELARFLGEDWVGHQQVVVDALTHTNLGGNLVLHSSLRERHRGESFVDLHEEGASTLHLQVVHLVKFALKNSAASLVLLRLTLARGDIDVKLEDITGSELVLLHILSAGLPVNDNLNAIDVVFLDLVHKNTLHGIAIELFGRLLNYIRHVLVSGADTNLTHGGLEGILSGKNHIGFATGDRSLTNDNRGCSARGESIEVGTNNDFGYITLGELGALIH